MKNRNAHILSFIIIILMMFFTVATSKPRDYETIYNKISYGFDNDYLIIRIETKDDPSYYFIEENDVQVNFAGMNIYQVFYNYIDKNNENQSKYVIVDYPKESIEIEHDDFVFETYVEDIYFFIRIKRELLLYDNVKIIYINLFNENIKNKEQYWNK
jgi:hypothetical protein